MPAAVRKLRPVLRFERFGKTGVTEVFVIYEVFLESGGFGAGVSAPGASPQRGD